MHDRQNITTTPDGLRVHEYDAQRKIYNLGIGPFFVRIIPHNFGFCLWWDTLKSHPKILVEYNYSVLRK
jgi:hypothetical protein